MTANGFLEANCLAEKGVIDTCSAKAFKEVNASDITFWSELYILYSDNESIANKPKMKSNEMNKNVTNLQTLVGCVLFTS